MFENMADLEVEWKCKKLVIATVSDKFKMK